MASMTARWLAPFLTVLCLSLAACEHGVDVSGTVRVPADVQALFSTQSPAEVVAEVQIPNVGTLAQTVGVLCAPGPATRLMKMTDFEFGCAKPLPTRVRAWTVAGVPGRCTVDQTGGPVGTTFDTAPARVEAQVTTTVHNGISGCKDGSVTFDVTLAPSQL